ncbi:MAG TPA: hypothetical protein VGB59_10390 [Allosphingosinicella sp.]|jgi:hypothetical protein
MADSRDKIAVVMVHGMGEQKPMETLRGFVEPVWVHDPAICGEKKGEVFSKPDDVSGSFELRRITTRHSEAVKGRCDFYEYYWAHQMTGTKGGAVFGWLRRLLVRRGETVPKRLRPHWRFGIGAMLVAILWAGATILCLLAVLGILFSGALILDPETAERRLLLWGGGFALLAAIGVAFRLFLPTLVRFVGDAARYFSPLPDNIAARHAIRQGGVELIGRLHERGYKRIVVASHSLGTVVAYDILSHAWAQIGSGRMIAAHPKGGEAEARLKALEAAAGALETSEPEEMPTLRRAYREAQRLYCEALASAPSGPEEEKPLWRVTDFVTMGSPLSKADVLLGYLDSEWRELKSRREAPACPPVRDRKGSPAFSYRPPSGRERIPHHAAVFGPTVWTNIFFENEDVYKGDVVAGEVAPRIGRGVIDIAIRRGRPTIRHTHYWSKPDERPAPAWIRALRAAVNLTGASEAKLWQGADEGRVIRAEALKERRAAPNPGSEEAHEPD